MSNNISLNSKDGDNQKCKMLPSSDVDGPTVRICCKADDRFSVTVRNGDVCLARTDPNDKFQSWIQDSGHGNSNVTDSSGYPAFALVNKSTGEAIQHSHGEGQQLKVKPYYPELNDISFLWTRGADHGRGFEAIRKVNDTTLNFDARGGEVHDDTEVVLWSWTGGLDNQLWQLVTL